MLVLRTFCYNASAMQVYYDLFQGKIRRMKCILLTQLHATIWSKVKGSMRKSIHNKEIMVY